MSEGTLTTVPPRALTVPAIPTPMTNMGIISDYGAPSDYENITDIPPDYSWMSALEVYKTMFTFSVNDAISKSLIQLYPCAKTDANRRLYKVDPDWHFIPFCSSRWWSGSPRLRFMAIKPPQVRGKLLITWTPDISRVGYMDTISRSIKYEWDLGTSTEYSCDLTGYNCTRLRQTWVPTFPASTLTSMLSIGQFPPMMQYTFGAFKVQVQSQLQPGSIFPDSIRILVFLSFQNTSFHTSTDLRGGSLHLFSLTGPLDCTVDPSP